MSILRIDVETFSSADLPEVGVFRYKEEPDFEITTFQYAFGESEPNIISLIEGEELPQHVLRSLTDPSVTKTAFNAAFEIATIGKHFNLELDPAQWRCTAVHALYLGMPAKLADVCRVVGLPEDKQKLSTGWALIRYFCMPCKPTKANGMRTRNLPHHDPVKWGQFKEYGLQDVVAEREVARRISRFPVPEFEHRLWCLDMRMNARGMLIQPELVKNAIDFDVRVKDSLTTEAVELTGLENPNSRNQLMEWLNEELEEGEEAITDVTKKTVSKLLKGASDKVVERVLQIRQELAKTSVSKYHAMARAVCLDLALRGLTRFYGANRTGRWAGQLVQIHNLPQNKLRDIDLARELVITGQFELFEMLFGNVPDTLSQLIRTAFVPRPGRVFHVVDFAAIEARVIAWLAWCEWRLEVFATHGKIYEASAEQMFKLPAGSVGKKSPYRQKGKIAELALGFGGGENALVNMGALAMGLKLEELEPIKIAWREANPEIASYDEERPGLWLRCENAAKRAVRNKTTVTVVIAGGRARLVFAYESGFLTIQLPSGRKLFYVKPRIEQEDLVRKLANGVEYIVARRGSLTYEGQDQKTKKWTRLATFGGKTVENITQAIARDCLAEAMLALDDEGYTQLTTIHDEDILEEDPNGPHTLARAEQIMGRPIKWAPDLLLRADGFTTNYYMKEIE